MNHNQLDRYVLMNYALIIFYRNYNQKLFLYSPHILLNAELNMIDRYKYSCFANVFFLNSAQKRPIQLLPVIRKTKSVLIVGDAVQGSVSIKKV